MVAVNPKPFESTPTAIPDEEEGETLNVPLVNGNGKDNFTDNGSGRDSASAPVKKPSGLGESAAFWLFMLFLASVTMTVGNKYVMKAWGGKFKGNCYRKTYLILWRNLTYRFCYY